MFNRTTASKAAPNTLCQKCLKRGHYSYECTASQQDRPYITRPSRTQQLRNPKLAPKLTETKLVEVQELNETTNESGNRPMESTERSRSHSVSSDDTVSTISTNRSRSISPEQAQVKRRTRTPTTRDSDVPKGNRRKDRDRSRSPVHEHTGTDTKRQRSLSPYSKRMNIGRS